MSRTLLIVICDFLLLSLLGLARFDVTGGEQPSEEVVVAENVKAEQDLIEILKLSLEAERASREDLAGDLDTTQQALADREETLAEREARLQAMAEDLERREAEARRLAEERSQLAEERSQLAERVSEAEENIQTLAAERAAQEDEARRARELAQQVERQLREKLAQLERTEQSLARLEERQREAEEANRRLSTQLELSETEKRLIRESLENVREEVALVRQEKDRVQEQARELAQGVTTLAERSGELAQEVRRAQPKTAATIFSDFLANRVEVDFTASRGALLGNVVRQRRTRSVLVSDGHQIYALFHLDDTGLSLKEVVDWERIVGRVSGSGQQLPVRQISFLSIDPRVVVVPVDRATADAFGTKVYQIAKEPFKFPEAVLINTAGNYYGESTFTVSAETPRYIRMQTRIFNRLFGEFSPSTGDLVFSKTEELIGVMVNNEFCVLVDNFLPAARLTLGESPTSATILGHMKSRVDRLPLRMQ